MSKSLPDRAYEAFAGVSASVLSTELCIEICEALERALVVAVLDGWEDADPHTRRIETWCSHVAPVYGLSLVITGVSRKEFSGSSRDEARAAAARAIEAGEV